MPSSIAADGFDSRAVKARPAMLQSWGGRREPKCDEGGVSPAKPCGRQIRVSDEASFYEAMQRVHFENVGVG